MPALAPPIIKRTAKQTAADAPFRKAGDERTAGPQGSPTGKLTTSAPVFSPRSLKSEISNLKFPRFNPRPDPLRTVLPTEHRQQRGERSLAECPVCRKVFCAASIVREPPSLIPQGEPLDGYSGWCFLSKLFCDHCDHIITWLTICGPDGVSFGDRIGGYGLLREPRAIAKHLRLHPQAAGVADVAQ